jgi:hypothetical protein
MDSLIATATLCAMNTPAFEKRGQPFNIAFS